jgi:serine protease Do
MTGALAIAAAEPTLHSAVAVELEALAARLRRVTVRLHTNVGRYDGLGAGVLWPAERGRFVVTNAHVLPPRRGDAAFVERAGGEVIAGRVIARDREHDLALVALPDLPDEWPAPARVGNPRAMRVGEIVVALGHPFGVGGALSVGVVHAVPNGDDALVAADIRLAPGNSGGPLATLDGDVIGINCMIVRGLGIAIPSPAVARFVSEAIAEL